MPCLIAYPNRFERAVALSGQGFTATLPLANLLTRQIAEVARAQQSIARLFVQLPTATAAELIALVGHNLSTSAKVRARAWAADPRTPLDATSKVATLDLPFSDWTALPSGLTLTSAAGYCWGADGLLKSVGANQPRFTHDRTTGAPLGLLLDGYQENRALWCRDGGNAAWSKNASMGAPALSATGIDGVANSATRLTAIGANARISQSATVSGSARYGVWLRGVSVTGAVSITGNNFTGTTAVTLTSSWQFFSVPFTSGSSFGIQIANSGDVIEMDFAYVGAFAGTGPGPTPIYTASSVVARTGDMLTYSVPAAMQASTLNGGLVWRGIVIAPANVNGFHDTTLFSANGATNLMVQLIQSSSNVVRVSAFGGSPWTGSIPTLGNRMAVALGWAATNSHYSSQDGAGSMTSGGTPNTVSGTFNTVTLSPSSYASVIHTRLSMFSATLNGTDCTTLANPSVVEPAPAFDSGWQDAWPAAWLAATTAEQREGVRYPAQLRTGAPQSYPWWRIDLSDPTNAEGFIQVGHVFMGTAWVPPRGMGSGASPGFQPRATITESYSGAEFFDDDQPTPLLIDFSLPCLSKSDALLLGLEMQRQLGTTRALFFSWDPADPIASVYLSCLARLVDLGRPVARKRNQWALPLRLKELL